MAKKLKILDVKRDGVSLIVNYDYDGEKKQCYFDGNMSKDEMLLSLQTIKNQHDDESNPQFDMNELKGLEF